MLPIVCLALIVLVSVNSELLYELNIAEVFCTDGGTQTIDIPKPTKLGNSVYIPVIFRTFPDIATATVGLVHTDGNALNPRELPLDAQKKRRLQEVEALLNSRLLHRWRYPEDTPAEPTLRQAAVELVSAKFAGSTCERVFLAGDETNPAFLPDTWEEARESFIHVCRSIGLSGETCVSDELVLFEGYPDDDVDYTPSQNFCSSVELWLQNNHLITSVVRRLKTGTYSGKSGASAPHGFSRGDRQYGYTTTSLGSRYRGGYGRSKFGYAGIAAVGVGGALGGFWMMRGGRGWGNGYSSSDKCEGDQCEFVLADGQKLYRDDFLDFGLVPDKFPWPQTLEFTSFAVKEKGSWCDPNDDNYIGDVPGLFFGLSLADDLEYEEDDDVDVGAIIVIIMIIIGVLMCSYFMIRKWRNKRPPQPQPQGQPYVDHAAPPQGMPTSIVQGTIVGQRVSKNSIALQ